MGVVLAIIFGNALLGFSQEYKSDKNQSTLQKSTVGKATAIRDSKIITISTNDIVVGDILHIKMGDQIPADMRLIEVINLEVDESLLTGESIPILKTTEPLSYPEQIIEGLDIQIGVGDRTNMVFRDTLCTSGTGIGVVTEVGLQTEVGKLSKTLLSNKVNKTPLQKTMDKFMYLLFIVAIILAFVIIGITGFRFDHNSILYATATGIALLPEALLAVVTVTLTLSVNRLSSKNAIVRQLSAVELLGSVTNICSDKTGTLTLGKMVVKRIWPANSKYIYHVTGGPMDATGGFGIEADINDPTNQATEELNRRASRAQSLANVRSHRLQSRTSIVDTRRYRAPSYAHSIPKVIQGTTDADYTKVQTIANDIAFVCAMCNNTQLIYDEEDDKLISDGGNPTEIALMVLSFKLGRSPFYWEDEGYIKCGSFPFDSTTKCMSVGIIRQVNDDEIMNKDIISNDINSNTSSLSSPSPPPSITNNKLEDEKEETEMLMNGIIDNDKRKNISKYKSYILCKGAPEVIFPKCIDMNTEDSMKRVNHLASQGFRVLACAIGTDITLSDEDGKRLHNYERIEVEKNLRFVGQVVVFDSPRPESLSAVQSCQNAGITFRMVTGDHHATAESIARRLQILQDHDSSNRVITGPIFDAMTQEQIQSMTDLPLVIARCSPESKVKLVQAQHIRGEIVAMTGDGINDAPAIRMADVGASMGITGVDVTKNISDIILVDDNIATLVNAIEEGRNISLSIKKFIVHQITSNVAEVVVLMIGLTVKDEQGVVVFPLTPLEILWVNMLTSTPPAIGLSMDEYDPDVMYNKPQKTTLFTNEVILDQMCYGLIVGILSLCSYYLVQYVFGDSTIGYNCNSEDDSGDITCHLVWKARSTCFVALNVQLLIQGYVCRSPRKSIFKQKFFNNLVLFSSLLFGTFLLLPTLYIPWAAHNLFKHSGIGYEWLIILVDIVIYIILTESYKYCKRIYYSTTVQRRRTIITEDGGRIEMVSI